jgi:DNA-binding transcriptional regulator YiaG
MTPEEQMDLLRIAARRAQDGSGRRIRTQNHSPLSLVAAHCGASIPAVQRWETGQRRPRGLAGARWALWVTATEMKLKADSQLNAA